MRRRWIDAYIDGELKGKKKDRFEEELRKDPELKKKVEREKRLVELMRSLANEPVSTPPPLPDFIRKEKRYLRWVFVGVLSLAMVVFLLIPKGAEFYLIYPTDGDVILDEVVLRIEKGGIIKLTIDGFSKRLKVGEGIITISLPRLGIRGPVNLSVSGRDRIDRIVYVGGLW